ncbi:2Fe-2S iron-sulfur cluster binding domain protein [Burkholderia ambifaria AMMD]|uniref:Pyridoxamine 5'-phosphate oxidase-related, FMN-binding protein n=1 Tax=Burkholderia ambifaria (strain ATCC BAA-244 / DSM 16087 / CCUG 44356 / LMG 19182 / AMMD) TaxID=339670 RepID=Q0B4F8_BURCM|nr:pyridoxamine 5'-phosphate oxidase family protein [Burkholderia ambifaria]ABI90965.1 pyridoxamine 5'-phosphate oxidase-related, FMN-binding protein [Burkholderia ambifaria AMMD]AJY24055.1 2Fe-2S iron-sulfur cluster binding domain protein [Burkholderia ambifaria AMMD]MBR7933594.1 pyridoxamine 5'-phosphate oxidase family protein [Burkholderia ambifaria]PEH68951.1 pyridoxamine 5'-phosphate oxidase [Burkholderia ambifaria]QQC06457.1 pyridoxamine 5'-phosphate oxidase family protein [Burkholderia 
MTAPTAAVPGWELDVAPFHAGELAVQQRAGVTEAAGAAGRRGIRRFMPDQHRAFFAQLPFFVLGGVDAHGQPWATLRVGMPGFVTAPDARTLHIGGDALPGDPLAGAWQPGAPLGGLGIEFDTRRRNRVNGVVRAVDGGALTIAVEQSFGNCAKYIQGRKATFVAREGDASGTADVSDRLSDADRALLAQADTFFVASANTSADAGAARGADVSHRGGMPGFVRVDDACTLTTPDFSGNRFFNTLGNLQHDPRAGLLFIDFDSGDVLYVAARAEIVWDGPLVASFDGAQRVVRFHVREVRRTRGVLPFRWSVPERAPQFAAIADGSANAGAQAASEPASASPSNWRPLRIAKIVDEARAIRSFHFEPADGGALPAHEAGQHLTLRIALPDSDAPAIRSYTLSDAPGAPHYRITVKREGRVSAWLHDHAHAGMTLDAQMPRGRFTFDVASPRPAVLVSAGIGITPMFAMLRRALADDTPSRRVVFVHGSRDTADRPFAAELTRIADTDARVALHWFDSRPQRDGAARPGRIDVAQLKRILPFDDYDFYLCGPSAFMRDLYDGLRALNVPDERIRFEAFGPSSVVRSAARATGVPSVASVPVVFRRSARDAAWTPADGRLLEFAEGQGVAVPSECRSGSCGTCATRVLSGAVDYVQSHDAPVEPGCALLCVAQPAEGATEPLVLDR